MIKNYLVDSRDIFSSTASSGLIGLLRVLLILGMRQPVETLKLNLARGFSGLFSLEDSGMMTSLRSEETILYFFRGELWFSLLQFEISNCLV